MKQLIRYAAITSLLFFVFSEIKTEKFATHGLIIFADIHETAENVGAMFKQVGWAFQSTTPFLIPGRFLYEYFKQKEFSIPKGFVYLRLPRGGLDNIQFYLCFPRVRLPQNLNSIIDPTINQEKQLGKQFQAYIPPSVTDVEKEHGLLLEHFGLDVKIDELANEKWMSEDKKVLTTKPPQEYLTVSRVAKSLSYVLERLFVPTALYPTNHPSWVLIFDGHGTQYVPQNDPIKLEENYRLRKANSTDTVKLQETSFLKERGIIATLDTGIFSQVIAGLAEIIDLRFIDIKTCYGGGINVGDLLREEETGVLPPYRFIIGTHTVIGDAPTHSCRTTLPDEANSFRPNDISSLPTDFYDKFFNVFFTIDFENPINAWNTMPYAKARKTVETAYKKVYDRLDEAYEYLIAGLTEGVAGTNDLPAYKPAEANYFIEVAKPWLMRIGKKELKSCMGGTLTIPKKIRAMLLYANTIDCTLSLEKTDAINAFLSAIPGDTFHIIKKLEPADKTKPLNSIKEILRSFCTTEKLKAKKLFHLKQLTNIELSDLKNKLLFKGSGEMMIRHHNNAITALLFSRKKRTYCKITGIKTSIENVDMLGIKRIALVPKEEGEDFIKQFNKEIGWLKQLANAQEPYRFLYDASIEMLPMKPIILSVVKKGNLATLKKLIERGNIDINVTDKNGKTPLMIAAKLEHIDLVKYLLEQPKIAINKKDADGKTALFMTNNLTIIKSLLAHGIDINAQDNEGRTALISVIRKKRTPKQLQVMKYLVTNGANPAIKDKDGKTAKDYAENRYALGTIARYLKSI